MLVLVFILLVASVGARGDIAKPVPIDGKCSVEADPLWTPQEIFVWLQVCVGKVADFNTAPGYGGDRDPKRPGGLPDNRILRGEFLETSS